MKVKQILDFSKLAIDPNMSTFDWGSIPGGMCDGDMFQFSSCQGTGIFLHLTDKESPFIAEDALSWEDECDTLDVVKLVITTGTTDNCQFTLNDGSTIV